MISPVKIWRNQKQVRGLLGKTGTVVSWTVIRVPPEGFANQAPYPVALVELDSGKRVMCQIVDVQQSEITFGLKVRLIIRRIKQPDEDGVIQYGIKAIPY